MNIKSNDEIHTILQRKYCTYRPICEGCGPKIFPTCLEKYFNCYIFCFRASKSHYIPLSNHSKHNM